MASRFVNSQIPTDLPIQVQDITFNVHKVLFCEQIKMRATMQGKEPVASGNSSEQEITQTSTNSEIMTIRAELENAKTQMTELQRECSELQLEYEKKNKRHMNGSAWNFG